MPRPKALMVFGTRPDAIKMAPVVRAFKNSDQVETLVAVTAQHRTQLDQVLETFSIIPDFDLDIMQHDQTLSEVTSRALLGLDAILREAAPQIILGQGDTTTTFAASLAAFYHKIPFGHVEAGLRTDNRFHPFPEEINRRLTSVLGDLHFAPTEQARDRLLQEGLPANRVFLTGNTVIDALLEVAGRPFQFDDARLSALAAIPGRVMLVTLHRRENLGEPMRHVCRAIRRALDQIPDLRVVFPMHLNPLVRAVVVAELGSHERVVLTEPQQYAPLVHLLKLSTIVLTDSGGIQEEAPSLGKPVLVARETTERPEGVAAGSARLVGSDEDRIFNAVTELLSDQNAYNQMARTRNPYGDGHAAERILAHTLRFLGESAAAPERP